LEEAGRPRTTWLRTTDDDLQFLKFGVHTAWRKAKDRPRETFDIKYSQYGNAPLRSSPIKKRLSYVSQARTTQFAYFYGWH